MGKKDQHSKKVFAEETERVTGGAVTWGGAEEIGLHEVHLDGLLQVIRPKELALLPSPWSLLGADEAVIEIKMQGDKLNAPQYQRGHLRRLARELQHMEAAERAEAKRRLRDTIPLWFVTSHRRQWFDGTNIAFERCAPGVYQLQPYPCPVLYIASNELPLDEALLPFLVTRRDRPLAEFVRWLIRERIRPRPWLWRLFEVLPMNTAEIRAMLDEVAPDPEDREAVEHHNNLVRIALDTAPEVLEEVTNKATLEAQHQVQLDTLLELFATALERQLSKRERKTVEAQLDAGDYHSLVRYPLQHSPQELEAWLGEHQED